MSNGLSKRISTLAPEVISQSSDQLSSLRDAVRNLETARSVNGVLARQTANLQELVRRMKCAGTPNLDPIISEKLSKAYNK